MILEQLFSVKPKSKRKRENRMTENDKIRDLEATSRNAKNLVNRVNMAHYGLDVDQLMVTVEKLADVMTKILEREADTDGRK